MHYIFVGGLYSKEDGTDDPSFKFQLNLPCWFPLVNMTKISQRRGSNDAILS